MAESSFSRVILWFTNNLRIQDNVLLQNKHIKNAKTVTPIFVHDPRRYGKQIWHHKTSLPTDVPLRKCDKFRAKFILECVENLNENLESLGSQLQVFLGQPEDIFKEIVKEDGALILTDFDLGTEESDLIKAVTQATEGRGKVVLFNQDTLISSERQEEIKKLFEKSEMVSFKKFRQKIEENVTFPDPVPTPKSLPPTENFSHITGFMQDPVTSDILGFSDFKIDDRVDIVFKGGEDAAHERLRTFLDKGLARYKDTRNCLAGKNHSSHLSPWLALGCITARQINAAVQQFENENEGQTKHTYWIIFELMWRDYFRFLFSVFRGRLFLPWGPFPKRPTRDAWKYNDNHFVRWINGTTGIPMVDANMRMLKETGWMSNRGRQNVASFLIFELGLDWRLGAAYFEQSLLDHDVCSNYGNWAFAANLMKGRQNRFNLIKQGFDYDPKGVFIKSWIPELKNIDPPKLFSPWLLSFEEQKKAGCIIGKDYAERVVQVKPWTIERKHRKQEKKKERRHVGRDGKEYWTY